MFSDGGLFLRDEDERDAECVFSLMGTHTRCSARNTGSTIYFLKLGERSSFRVMNVHAVFRHIDVFWKGFCVGVMLTPSLSLIGFHAV